MKQNKTGIKNKIRRIEFLERWITGMILLNFFEKYRTDIMGLIIALILILAGLLLPQYIPDNPNAPAGFQDATWVRTIVSLLLIGMGVVSLFWLIVIHRFMLRRKKKDLLY